MDKTCGYCGAVIPNKWRLCEKCAAEFGTDPKQWPEWFRYLVSDNQREWNASRRSREIYEDDVDSIFDPRASLIERVDGHGFLILRGCYDPDEEDV